MITSRDEAVSFLRKLNAESTTVVMVLLSPGLIFGLSVGSIATVDSGYLSIQQAGNLPIVISTTFVYEFEYAEVGEFLKAMSDDKRDQLNKSLSGLSGTIEGILIMKFQSGIIALIEIAIN